MGLINASNVVSFGVGPLIAGVSFDQTGSYTGGFLLTAGLFLVGATALGADRWRQYREARDRRRRARARHS